MSVSYRKQTLESPNPLARLAHRARYKHSLELARRFLPLNGTLLDFGCGDGTLLAKVSTKRPDAKLLGFEPDTRPQQSTHTMVASMESIGDKSLDVLCCFETLEHLYDHERQHFYSAATRVLGAKGVVLISVPIIGGPTLLLKELNRSVVFRRASDYSLPQLLKASFLGTPAPKPGNPRITHKGFDFRALEGEMQEHFEVLEKFLSPFARLPWYLNSQVFYVLRADSSSALD